jgi:hypothetical protein
MMRGQNQRAPFVVGAFRLGGGQLLTQKIELHRAHLRPGDHALRAAFTGIGIQTDELDEGRVQREVNPRLIHGGAHRALAVRIQRGRRRTEVGDKRAQRFGRLSREDDSVMIAGNGEDGSVVVAVRIVELLEVILVLPEEIDDVAQVIPERRAAG